MSGRMTSPSFTASSLNSGMAVMTEIYSNAEYAAGLDILGIHFGNKILPWLTRAAFSSLWWQGFSESSIYLEVALLSAESS